VSLSDEQNFIINGGPDVARTCATGRQTDRASKRACASLGYFGWRAERERDFILAAASRGQRALSPVCSSQNDIVIVIVGQAWACPGMRGPASSANMSAGARPRAHKGDQQWVRWRLRRCYRWRGWRLAA
jgi:hypothetical protein